MSCVSILGLLTVLCFLKAEARFFVLQKYWATLPVGMMMMIHLFHPLHIDGVFQATACLRLYSPQLRDLESLLADFRPAVLDG